MHGAGAAHRDPAAIFRACDAKVVAQDPQQRHVAFDIHLVRLAVDLEAHGSTGLAALCREGPCSSVAMDSRGSQRQSSRLSPRTGMPKEELTLQSSAVRPRIRPSPGYQPINFLVACSLSLRNLR